MADVALALDGLIPGAVYGGSLTANTQSAYDDLSWEDERPKPEWSAILAWEAPLPVLSQPVLSCIANFHVEDGGVSSVEDGATGLAFIFAIDTNVFWAYFNATMDSTNYSVNANSSSGRANVTDRQTDYMEITVSDPTEPYVVTTQVFRTV